MSPGHIASDAFRRAALRSESYRIQGLLCLLGALLLYATARGLAFLQLRLLLAEALLVALAIAYEAFMLAVVKVALRRGTDVPPAMWALNVLAETQIPTLALFLLINSGLMTPERVLIAPAVLVYFLFIILSALRLSPGLSLLTGLMAALGYLAVTLYAAASHLSSEPDPAVFPLGVYFIYASLFVAGGAVAAFVAGQVRAYVAAALREAELQSELEKVNHDLDLARTIQEGLLPASPPELDDFEVAGWNKPADQTGGDYFDWQTLLDGRLAVSLGDATGHGIGPALVSASCRAYVRASFLTGAASDELLGRLNRLLSEDLPSNRFITFVAALLDPSSARLTVLSAGHGPILWYRYKTDRIERLEAQGIPLGMIAGVAYGRGAEVCLAPGDMLALITDGFYEWENPEGEEFGVKRLEAVLRESRDLSTEGVIVRLRAAVAAFCRGTEQKDDLTAVILRRKVGPPHARRSADVEPAFPTRLPARAPAEIHAPQTGAHG